MFSQLSPLTYVAITLAMTHVTIVAVTLFLHRHQAHRALELHPALSHFFRFWLWLTTGIVTRAWVAIHRKHHARVETVDDPHSPQVLGIGKVLGQGAELYRREAQNAETLLRYGHGTPDDWLERNIYATRSYHGIFLMLGMNLILFGPVGLTIWAVQMVWIPIFAAGIINGVGHYLGYRNFEPADASTNIVPLGLLIGGEELHNNHHAFATSAKFSSRWFEFDLGWGYIRLFEALGLARVRRLPPVAMIDDGKRRVDVETVRAVVENRLHVMSCYARQVIDTVYRDERSKADRAARRFLARSRALLRRHERLVDDGGMLELQNVLERHPALRTAYEFRCRLQAIWQERNVSQERLLDALHEWCESAESTGIAALGDFARMLKGYRLVGA